MNIIDHVEKHLGEFSAGWNDKSSDHNISIISFKDRPVNLITTFFSLGLSHHIFELPKKKEVKFELVFSTYTTAPTNLIVSFLISLCEAIIDRHKAILMGEVIPFSSELAKKVQFDGVYCTMPVYFDDSFHVFDQISPPIVIVWAIPVFKKEMDFIYENGWELFETFLEEKNPDLYLLDRDPVV